MRISSLTRVAGLIVIAALAISQSAIGADVQETDLTSKVRSQLVRLPFLSVFDNLEFIVEGSQITLLGQTVRPTLKAAAARVVAKLEGVDSVNNQIEVLPLSPHDDRLRIQIYRSIYSSAGFSRLAGLTVAPIRIIVKNGDVTLEGTVLREADKVLAGVLANRAQVFSVTNNLRTEI